MQNVATHPDIGITKKCDAMALPKRSLSPSSLLQPDAQAAARKKQCTELPSHVALRPFVPSPTPSWVDRHEANSPEVAQDSLTALRAQPLQPKPSVPRSGGAGLPAACNRIDVCNLLNPAELPDLAQPQQHGAAMPSAPSHQALAPTPGVANTTNKPKAAHRRVVDPNTGKTVAPNTPGAVAVGTFYNRRLVDPDTGKAVLPGTLGAICASTFYDRRPVDPVTGKPVLPNTPNAITAASYRKCRLVDPITGKPVLPGTKDAIAAATFKSRRPVDAITGKPVSPDTPGAIAAATFKCRRPVDPDTGKPVLPNTPGAIAATTFKSRRLVDRVTGKAVLPGTRGAIASATYQSRKLVDAETGKSVAPGTPGAIAATIFKNRKSRRKQMR